MIAKSGMPFTVEENLIIPPVKEVISTVMERDPTQVVKALPLSNDTVSRRINEMGADSEEQLCAILRDTQFSLPLDETTTADNNALLMAYVGYKAPNTQEMAEEFMFARYLVTDTRGQTIFNAVDAYLREKAIPITNILTCATDGAPAMVGQYRGFTSLLKERVPHVLTVHCVIHRHNLVAKAMSTPLHDSINIAVKVINKIKSHALNDRLFRQLCHANEEEFGRLLLYSDVRWVSEGNCLARFCELFDSVVEFLEEADAALAEKVCSSRCDIMYLADFFDKMNEVTLKLQGNGMTLVKSKAVIQSLICKLTLYRQNIGRQELLSSRS